MAVERLAYAVTIQEAAVDAEEGLEAAKTANDETPVDVAVVEAVVAAGLLMAAASVIAPGVATCVAAGLGGDAVEKHPAPGKLTHGDEE